MYISLKIVDSKRCSVALSKEFWLQFDITIAFKIQSPEVCLRPPLSQLAEEAKRISKVVPSMLCFIYTSDNKAYLRLLNSKEELELNIVESVYLVELTPENNETAEGICSKLKEILFPPKSLKDELPKFFGGPKSQASKVRDLKGV
jgi:hypothetical protein